MKIAKRIRKALVSHGGIAVGLLILVVAVTCVAFVRYVSSPVNHFATPKIIDIPKGAGFFRITEIMDDAGLVANRPFFWLLAFVKGVRKQIRAGEYEITGSLSPAEILDKLVRGEIKYYTVMLPEDITVNEVAKRLLVDKLINEKEFMALAVDREFLASLGIEADSIEGYLFPETYQFDRSMTTQEVIRIIVRQFWKEITPAMRSKAERMGLTLTEWVTLASIIGKESGNREEKPLISAVFHNRMKRGMKLQSDPTAVYHLERAGTPVKTVLQEPPAKGHAVQHLSDQWLAAGTHRQSRHRFPPGRPQPRQGQITSISLRRTTGRTNFPPTSPHTISCHLKISD